MIYIPEGAALAAVENRSGTCMLCYFFNKKHEVENCYREIPCNAKDRADRKTVYFKMVCLEDDEPDDYQDEDD